MHASVLKYFVEVARCGSLRKASEKLYVAPSALTRQITKLEEEIGSELFDRLPNGMRLNPAGERLLKHVQTTLLDFQSVRGEIDALKGQRTGHIKVAAVDSAFLELLPAAVEEFAQVFPAVKYTMTGMSTMDVLQQLLSGRADIGVTFVGRLPVGVVSVCLAGLSPGVIMAAGHPLAERAAISLSDCADQPHLTWGNQSQLTGALSNDFTKFWNELEPVLTCNSTAMVKRMIIAGMGISFFSKIAFLDELARGEVVWRPFEEPELSSIQIGIVIPTQRKLSAVAQNFVSRVERRLRHMEAVAAAMP